MSASVPVSPRVPSSLPVVALRPNGFLPGSPSALKVRRMTLFANGLCNYELCSKVVGDATLTLTIRASHMDKLLSSLTVVDLSGRGIISSISYESPGYEENMLQEIGPGLGTVAEDYMREEEAYDRKKLFGNPGDKKILGKGREKREQLKIKRRTVAQDDAFTKLIRHAVGTRVAVEVRGSSSRKSNVSGILLGSDSYMGSNDMGDKGFCLVILVEGFEVRCVDVADVKNIRFHDREIQKQFRTFSTWRDTRNLKRKRNVVIRAKGEGVRSISANFLVPMPAWKTSYRFLISPDALLIQGWAVIDNITDQDLENVELSLISELPEPLSTNLYSAQPHRPPSTELEDAADLRRRITGMSIGSEDSDGDSNSSNRQLRFQAQRSSAIDRRSGKMNGIDYLPEDDFTRTISAKSNRSLSFEHKVANSVSIRRFESALVPMIMSECYGGRVGLYNAETCPDHVFSAVQILNSTRSVLEAGPVTIFDDGVYVGEALLPRSLPEQMDFLPYAVDKSFLASTPKERETSKVVKAVVEDGKLSVSRETVRTTHYQFTNLRNSELEMYVEHNLKNGDFAVASCEVNENKTIKPRGSRGSVVQYLVHFKPDDIVSMVVKETDREASNVKERDSLAHLTEEDIVTLVEDNAVTEIKAANLRDVVAHMRRKQDFEEKLNILLATEARLIKRQRRIEGHLQTLKELEGPEAGRITAQYLGKLDKIDDELEEAHRQIEVVRGEQKRLDEEIDKSVKEFSG